MDDALALFCQYQFVTEPVLVLILVVMDDALALYLAANYTQEFEWCLNPCCNG